MHCYFTNGKWGEDGKWHPGAIETTSCHYILQGGMLNFCGDCQHEFNGKQGVPLPFIPEGYGI